MRFSKYHGAGNDFIIIDDRDRRFSMDDKALIEQMCDRRFGIGADGLMLLQYEKGFDFRMVYYNADGNPSSMCGNGGRCLVAYAHRLGVIGEKAEFIAVDGPHRAQVISSSEVRLAMNDVETIESYKNDALLIDTGSPHYITKRAHVASIDVRTEGRAIRNEDPFKVEGVNVNFVQKDGDAVHIRTYERGVEDETLACGTGVTAAALAMAHWDNMASPIQLHAVGGDLTIEFEEVDGVYTNIWKTGPVAHVFDGEWKS